MRSSDWGQITARSGVDPKDKYYGGGSQHALQISGFRGQWYVEELVDGSSRLWDVKSFENYTRKFQNTPGFLEDWVISGLYSNGTTSWGALVNMVITVIAMFVL